MKRPHGSNRLTRIAALLAIANAQDDKAARRNVVSIPDRKLALREGERVLKVYDVAVGKPATPSPHGEFKIVSRAISLMWGVDYYKQPCLFYFWECPSIPDRRSPKQEVSSP